MTWRVARGGTRVSGPAREAPADDALAAAAVSRTPSAERATRDAERHPRLDPGWLLLLLAGLGFVVLVGAQLWRPLMYDDVNFYLAGKQVAETGRPFGNQGWMGDRDDFSQREQWGLWHPPLYVYLLGLFARVGGATAAVMRLPGLLGGLAAGGLTGLLTYDLTRGPPAERRLAAGVAAVLVLLCPLSIQSALILDIDFSLLLPLTLLFLVLYVRLEATRRSLLLAPLLALLLWAKMTNPLPLLAAIVTWQVLHGRFLRAARDLVGLGLGGALLFGLTYMPAGRLLGFPLDMPFGVNLSQWQGSADVARRAYTSPGAFVEALQPTVLWLGPGLVGLGLLGIGVRSACLVREWRLRRVDLLIGLLVLLVVGYVNKYAGWLPKYEVSMAPLLAVLGAPLVARALTAVGAPRDARARADVGTPHGAATTPAERQSVPPALAGSPGETPPAGPRSAPPARAGTPVEQASEPGMMRIHRPPTAVVLGLLAGLSVAAFVVDAGLVADSWALKRTWSIDPTAGAWFLALIAVAVACRAWAAPLGLVAIAIGWSVATDVLQVGAPYSTSYYYGTTGTLEAAAWIDANLAAGATYVAAKEVAILAHNQRYVDQESLEYLFSTGAPFYKTWAGEPIPAVIAWQREPNTAEVFQTYLAFAGYSETARFGDYVVYQP